MNPVGTAGAKQKTPANTDAPSMDDGSRFRENAFIRIAHKTAAGLSIAATGSIILDAGHSDALVYRETLTNKTFTGFTFEGLGVDPATIAGPGAILRRVSVNATLNASVAYTYADDLAFYLDIPPLSTAGRLQIGGFQTSPPQPGFPGPMVRAAHRGQR